MLSVGRQTMSLEVKSSNWVVTIFLFLAALGVGYYISDSFQKTALQEHINELNKLKKESAELLKQNQKLKDSGQIILKQNEALISGNMKRDSQIVELKNKTKTQLASINKLRAQNDSLLKAIDSTLSDDQRELIVGLLKELDSTLNYARTEKSRADSAEVSRDGWKQSYDNMKSFAALETKRANSAEAELKRVVDIKTPKDPEKLFGLIKMPSRTVVFFVGAAVGAGTTLAVSK